MDREKEGSTDIKELIEFNTRINDRMVVVCQSIFNEIDVNMIEYGRFFKDGTFFYICSNLNWHKVFLEKFSKSALFIEHIKSVFHEGKDKHVWDTGTLEHGEFASFIEFRHTFEIWNDFTLYKHNIDFVEFWGFSTHRQANISINTYMNFSKNFDHYIVYFKEQAFDIIKHADSIKIQIVKERICFSNIIQSVIHKNREFLKKIRVRHYLLETSVGSIPLTCRQLQCLGYKSRGLSVKEIAKKINLYEGTVRTHIDNIKKKALGIPLSKLKYLFSMSVLADLSLGALCDESDKKTDNEL